MKPFDEPTANISLQRTGACAPAAELGSLAGRSRVVAAISVLLWATACSSSPRMRFGSSFPPAEPVSLQAVIADPQAFRGRTLRIDAFLSYEFESHALYDSDVAFRAPGKCLWIVFSPD
jgi:hypothetical protein